MINFECMNSQKYNVVGVMSGTSLDGVDLAHIVFSISEQIWDYQILECETIPYSDEWIDKLKKAVGFSVDELKKINKEYTLLLSQIVNEFILKNKLQDLDAVCSHGHTILHQPNNGLTLQIGNLPEISTLINQNVVCDFRIQDVMLGGQGAPLVPIGDQILFSQYEYCLNLGGFSNISFDYEGKRLAFDISPVNTVLNFYANELGFVYDDKGRFGMEGVISDKLFCALNDIDFYQKPFPKSLGFEFVKSVVLPLIETSNLSIYDKLRTFIEHIAFQIAKALPIKKGSILITGGGVYNDFLIQRIKFYCPDHEVVIPDKKTIEFKEALIFGLLGVLKLRDEINVLSSVTGSKTDHCSGNVFLK